MTEPRQGAKPVYERLREDKQAFFPGCTQPGYKERVWDPYRGHRERLAQVARRTLGSDISPGPASPSTGPPKPKVHNYTGVDVDARILEYQYEVFHGGKVVEPPWRLLAQMPLDTSS